MCVCVWYLGVCVFFFYNLLCVCSEIVFGHRYFFSLRKVYITRPPFPLRPPPTYFLQNKETKQSWEEVV